MPKFLPCLGGGPLLSYKVCGKHSRHGPYTKCICPQNNALLFKENSWKSRSSSFEDSTLLTLVIKPSYTMSNKDLRFNHLLCFPVATRNLCTWDTLCNLPPSATDRDSDDEMNVGTLHPILWGAIANFELFMATWAFIIAIVICVHVLFVLAISSSCNHQSSLWNLS